MILGGTTLALRELLSNLPEFFLRGVSVRRCSGFVSSRLGYYGLVRASSISVFSPVVKRGRSCSRNCGLGIGIRADNSRFVSSPDPWRYSCGARVGR